MLFMTPQVVMMYGRRRSVKSSGEPCIFIEGGDPNESRKDSRLWTNLERAKELKERVSTGRMCMRCAFVGMRAKDGKESPLWKGGVGGR